MQTPMRNNEMSRGSNRTEKKNVTPKQGEEWKLIWRGNLGKREADGEAWLLQEVHSVEAAKEDRPQDTAPLYLMWAWFYMVSP
jgi:hypothetical protein